MLTAARRLAPAAWPGLALLATALVATWPLVSDPFSTVALGTEEELTVPMFSIWNLWWTADRITHGFAGFWNAPFFHPNPGVTTYSEPMPLIGVIVSPLWAAGATPALVANVALIAVLTLNGVFARRVALELTDRRDTALLAGIATVTLPFVAGVLGVLPNVALFGMLWTFDGLLRFARTGRGPDAAWAAAGFCATFLSFQQHALFFAPIAAAAWLVAWSRRDFSAPAVARLASAAAIAALFVVAVALPSIRIHSHAGFSRPADVVHALSARPADYLTRPQTASAGLPSPSTGDTSGLFPGVTLAGLGLAGIGIGLRDPDKRAWAALLSGMAVYGFVVSLGLRLSIAGWQPFASLRAAVPALAEVRSPYRAAVLVQVALPLLAAIGLGRVASRMRRGTALAVALGLLAAVENVALPARVETLPRPDRAAWAETLAARDDLRVLAHVPFPSGLHVSDYEIEARRMLAGRAHGKRIVNGYSGFFPTSKDAFGRVRESYTSFQLEMARAFPTQDLLCVLAFALGAEALVADGPWLAANRERLAAFEGQLRVEYEDAEAAVYSLHVDREACGPPRAR